MASEHTMGSYREQYSLAVDELPERAFWLRDRAAGEANPTRRRALADLAKLLAHPYAADLDLGVVAELVGRALNQEVRIDLVAAAIRRLDQELWGPMRRSETRAVDSTRGGDHVPLDARDVALAIVAMLAVLRLALARHLAREAIARAPRTDRPPPVPDISVSPRRPLAPPVSCAA